MESDAELAAEMDRLVRQFEQEERQRSLQNRENEILVKETEIRGLFGSLAEYYIQAARYTAHPNLFERNRQRIKQLQDTIELAAQKLIELRHPGKLPK